MRVQIWRASAQAGHGQCEANQTLAFERAQYLAAGMRRNDKDGVRDNFEVGFAPDFSLQHNAGAKFFEALAGAYNDFAAHRLAALGVPAACPLPGSEAFARSHSASISSRGTSASFRPDSAAMRSISRNREENFVFVRCSAISGSTFKNRARFTPANSTSPISSSTCGNDCDSQ